mmetsp:Transcript_14121/g.10185  ORF Transcript_14121/g.10185 Transcript_14121/m.10185 type:complete len:122 (+) Transcript_14121:2512-2877(+)
MEWYFKVGAIFAQTLFILSLSPYIDISIYVSQALFKQVLDMRRLCRPRGGKPARTHSKTIQQFVNAYKGPEMSFHYRYSAMMVVVFFTMLYGVGLPILFPIALLCLVTMYVVDRLLTVYVY